MNYELWRPVVSRVARGGARMHDYLNGLAGGALIGAASAAYLYFTGRILGVSGMLGQAMNPETAANSPAIYFFAGLLLVAYAAPVERPKLEGSGLELALAGLLVGIGTRMASGCTSGHGVCGLSRWSLRSLVAVGTFMSAGFFTVFIKRHLVGAA